MKKASVLLFLALLVASTASASIIYIDRFNSPPPFPTVTSNVNGVVNSIMSSDASVLELNREIAAECVTGCGTIVAPTGKEAKTSVSSTDGSVAVSSLAQGNAYFFYQGLFGTGFNNGVGLDWTMVDKLILTVLQTDSITVTNPPQGPPAGTRWVATVSILSGPGAGVLSSLDTYIPQNISSPTDFSWNLAGFVGLQKDSIREIKLDLVSIGDAADIALDDFRANQVPEPGTYAMLGAGLAGLAMLRRRTAK